MDAKVIWKYCEHEIVKQRFFDKSCIIDFFLHYVFNNIEWFYKRMILLKKKSKNLVKYRFKNNFIWFLKITI